MAVVAGTTFSKKIWMALSTSSGEGLAMEDLPPLPEREQTPT